MLVDFIDRMESWTKNRSPLAFRVEQFPEVSPSDLLLEPLEASPLLLSEFSDKACTLTSIDETGGKEKRSERQYNAGRERL